MNRNAFTLIELLAVIVILSIIMGVAIPNVVSTLEKSKKETYISDAKKFLTLAKTSLATGIDKPTEGNLVKIKLSCVDNEDLAKSPDGDPYNEDKSYVIVTKKNGSLIYYVSLVSTDSEGKNRGIELVEKSQLEKDGRLSYVRKNIKILDDSQIKSKIGVSGCIRECGNYECK